jgi:tetratricopeptide (TPR) repeat protein
MECPFCDAPLQEISSISEADQQLISSLPYVIAYPLQRTLNEKHALTRVNLFRDTFLNYLKYLGLLTASEFFNSPLKDKKMVALFHQTLTEPSFGSWNHYIREALKFLSDNDHKFFCPELYAYYATVETGKKRKLYKGEIEVFDSNGDVQLKNQEATAIGMLINFRNRYLGHGLTLDESASQQLFNEYFPIFRTLLEQMKFTENYRMFKHEHGESWVLQSAALRMVEKGEQTAARVWIENANGQAMDILPFFVVPGELSIGKEDIEQILTYESYTGKTIKFFSPEGTEKQTSGKILERLNLLLRDKQKEQSYLPEDFTKEVFLARIADENKLILDTLIAEKKVIPGVYVHRREMEIKLREWIGARASIFFIAAEAGSGKTNLLVEIQKQYAERNLPGLLIRAGRMEKSTLKQQIAWLLNIDIDKGLCAYPAIAGTQAEPTFILIDGLNEASNDQSLWNEVIEISRYFEPGCLKFVVSSRVNSKQDLARYDLPKNNQPYDSQAMFSDEIESDLLYGLSDNLEGLGSAAIWLTPLSLVEIEEAWQVYCSVDRKRFKPLFSFSDLAYEHRYIYDEISNPLILRLLLELNNGKPLFGKDKGMVRIWETWFKSLSFNEQQFLKNLALEIWYAGINELDWDALQQHPVLGPVVGSDDIKGPYLRLRNFGWISRYHRGLNHYLNFTVEASLFFILGLLLEQESWDVKRIIKYVDLNESFRISSLAEMLINRADRGDLSLLTEIIDSGTEVKPEKSNFLSRLYINPLLHHLKLFGPDLTIEKIFSSETTNDWTVLLELDTHMLALQWHQLRNSFLQVLKRYIKFRNFDEILLGIRVIEKMNYDEAEIYLSDYVSHLTQTNNLDLLEDLPIMFLKFEKYDEALILSQRGLEIAKTKSVNDNLQVSYFYQLIGRVYYLMGNSEFALKYHLVNFEILKKIRGSVNKSIATSHGNLGLALQRLGRHDEALAHYMEGLKIRLKILGENHESVATSYNNIGRFLRDVKDYEKAFEYYEKSLAIRLKIFGKIDLVVANSYWNIGGLFEHLENFEMALCNYERCLEIRINNKFINNSDLSYTFYAVGRCFFNLEKYEPALKKFLNAYDLDKNCNLSFWIAHCYEELQQRHLALNYYIESSEIAFKYLGVNADETDLHEAVANSKRLAAEMGKENELPEWMKDYD